MKLEHRFLGYESHQRGPAMEKVTAAVLSMTARKEATRDCTAQCETKQVGPRGAQGLVGPNYEMNWSEMER
jgi:hypothetical protein